VSMHSLLEVTLPCDDRPLEALPRWISWLA
jgi:hypothetical protein